MPLKTNVLDGAFQGFRMKDVRCLESTPYAVVTLRFHTSHSPASYISEPASDQAHQRLFPALIVFRSPLWASFLHSSAHFCSLFFLLQVAPSGLPLPISFALTFFFHSPAFLHNNAFNPMLHVIFIKSNIKPQIHCKV